ncbi:hypothetical protein HY571_02840 [Candidatus Micrarchaeota archaeon]|nr:hypothetical protein [Candidatus Micrarchaeota archaeon]
MIKFLKNFVRFLEYKGKRRGIEGMPLKLAIIIIAAAVVIAIILSMTGTLRSGIGTATGEINRSLVERVNTSLNNT